MIGASAKYTDSPHRVHAAVKKAKYVSLKNAALSIRKDASQSIKHRRGKVASPEGQPPYQHKPGFFKRALWAHFEENEAIAGFRGSLVGEVAATHEHGLIEEGRDYPERPTMAPALERNVERFHKDWRASVG
jgi:hypothetical protein